MVEKVLVCSSWMVRTCGPFYHSGDTTKAKKTKEQESSLRTDTYIEKQIQKSLRVCPVPCEEFPDTSLSLGVPKSCKPWDLNG